MSIERLNVQKHKSTKDVRYFPLGATGVVAEFLLIYGFVLVLKVAKAGIARLPDGALCNYVMLPYGNVAFALVLVCAAIVFMGMFYAFGGGGLQVSTDAWTLMEAYKEERDHPTRDLWKYLLALFANVVARFLASFLAGLTAWGVVGTRHRGYPADIGLNTVAISPHASVTWSWFRVVLVEMAVSFFFTIALLLVWKRGMRRDAGPRTHHAPFSKLPLVLFGVLMGALYLGSSGIVEPTFFWSSEVGPATVHTFASTYSLLGGKTCTADFPFGDNTSACYVPYPHALLPTVDSPPFDACKRAVESALATNATSNVWGMNEAASAYLPLHSGDGYVKFGYAFIHNIIAARIFGTLVGQTVGFFLFWLLFWAYRKTMLGESRPLETFQGHSKDAVAFT